MIVNVGEPHAEQSVQPQDTVGPVLHRQRPDPTAVSTATVTGCADGAAEAAAEARPHPDSAELAEWDAGTAAEEQQMQCPALSGAANNVPVWAGRALLPDEGGAPTADSPTSYQDR